MVQVSPPPHLKIPEAFMKDEEISAYMRQKDFILFQLWNRTGGASDEVTGNEGFLEARQVSNVDELVQELETDLRPRLFDDERIQDLEVEAGLRSPNITPQLEQVFIETAVNYTQTEDDDVIYSTASLTITLLDPAVATKICRFRSITGTMTLTPSTGTVETASLTVGQAQTMGPRDVANGWFDL